MQTNGIALGHDVIFSITERSISRIWLGWLRLCHKDAWPPCEPTWGQKKSDAGARAGSVLGNGRARPGCTQRHAAGDAHAKHVEPAFVEIEQMRIQQ